MRPGTAWLSQRLIAKEFPNDNSAMASGRQNSSLREMPMFRVCLRHGWLTHHRPRYMLSVVFARRFAHRYSTCIKATASAIASIASHHDV
ncbi:hypothetical protein C2E31_10255 [Rhodopirellula baltica]|nr:hypothetical protein C2E31_10255 [Rhodopirellula baltica]